MSVSEGLNVVDLLFAGLGSFKFNCGCSQTVKTSSSGFINASPELALIFVFHS